MQGYTPIQLVAPNAVKIAVAIDATNCAMNFSVSFLDIVIKLKIKN